MHKFCRLAGKPKIWLTIFWANTKVWRVWVFQFHSFTAAQS